MNACLVNRRRVGAAEAGRVTEIDVSGGIGAARFEDSGPVVAARRVGERVGR
jgi:hypothetical protein